MKRFLSAIPVALTAVSAALMPVAASADPVTLYGVKTYCESGCSNGLYTVVAEPGEQPELYWADGDMMGSGGAVYADGTLYVLNYLDFMGELYWTYLVCDVDNKTYDYSFPENLSFSDVGSAMTFDPATGNIYSICIDSEDTSKFTLSVMDPQTGAKTAIAPIERMGAMAADAEGVIYGIGMDGNLYIVNKANGGLDLIGSTGVKPRSNQSAVIDYKTGVMYWNAFTDDGGFLYTVDLATAEATLMTTFDNKFQFSGLFIKQSVEKGAVPASPENVRAEFEGISLSGSVTFTVPEKDVDGTALTGDVAYTVKSAETVLAEGTAAPGSNVSAPVSVETRGKYQFIVTLSNAEGTSKPASASLWVGSDDPLAVVDLQLAVSGLDVVLTWNLPERGVNGGAVDMDAIRYVVIRGPYEEVVTTDLATNRFTETLDITGVEPLMYGVKAYIDPTRLTELVVSNAVNIGEFCAAPYSADLTDPFRHLVFSIYDANNDNCSWVYNSTESAMMCDWAAEPTSNDWIVTPAVLLEQGRNYKAVATVRSEGLWNFNEKYYEDVYCGKLGVYLGKESAPQAMVTELLEPVDVTSIDYTDMETRKFTVPETGLYYVGYQHSGTRSIYNMFMKGVDIKVVDSDAIDAPTVEGELTITVEGRVLSIVNPAMSNVQVVALDGRTVSLSSAENQSVALERGIYIVTADGKSTKVAVR